MRNLYLIIILVLVSCQTSTLSDEKTDLKPKINYYAQGKEITSFAQSELGKNLKMAMEEGGPSHAIKFCNINALSIMDSLSKIFNVKIQRVALKNRNSHNAAIGVKEKILLNNFLEYSLEGKSLHDTLIAFEGKLLYYRPIMIGAENCLKCHGQIGKNIATKTMLVINDLYPNDKATNYRLGEFRGVWKLTFSNLNENY